MHQLALPSAFYRPDEDAALPGYQTAKGQFWAATIERWLDSRHSAALAGRVNLVFTSPPFPLVRKKSYGNLEGGAYVRWLEGLAPRLAGLLAPDGSLVIEMGNAWNKGTPTMSTTPVKALLAFLRAGRFNLVHEFIWHNPARLPGPAQWVCIDRCRLSDTWTRFWWLSRAHTPKAYPERFPEVTTLLRVSNTRSAADAYVRRCRELGVPVHPARMPPALPRFFVQFLTDPGDLVLDPFAGSNTTGSVAEQEGRRWVAIEANQHNLEPSRARFVRPLSVPKVSP
jgi:DNA modification methylase